uniref:F-box/LRR-repeat protein At5g54820 n=1 Tax=Nicotiana tabacum TaxID=4097 RepID=A0A1S4CMN4_TOBAC|nr:PREDICTED: putative F-box/LRR-repeat protein At5g54820 [Nicotiana tabacum]
MDRTSELPTQILHNILSRLPTKTAARTSVLSKPWLKACSTNSHLSFDESDFKRRHGKFVDFHGQFLRIVDNTLEKYHHEKIPVSNFKLCILFSDQTDCDGIVDKWFDIIAKKRVSQPNFMLRPSYHEFMMISYQYCNGFSCIRISNLPNLLSLHILCCPIEEVHIVDAPKLLSFEYVNQDKLQPSSYGVDVFLRSLNIGTCQNLRRVEFVKATIDDTDLFQLIQKLPFIKELSLRYCKYLKILKISSSICSIGNCECLVQAIFDVPKLLSLVFSNQFRLPSLSFERASSQCRISIDYRYMWNAQQFIDLRRFLVELNGQPVDLTLSNTLWSLRASGIRDHHPTPQVENLISISGYSTASYSTYFDAIFWTCWPKCLTVQCDQRFRKFLRQQLLKKYYWRLSKYTWKEYLINAHIEYKRKIEDNWMTLDTKVLAANSRIIEEIHTIRFKQA